MRHGSLFSGIGGFDYAAQMMGWENVFHCEWNEFGQRVLKHYWPQAISYHDITKTDFTIHRGAIDILSGGFPCQPYSTAGKRLGKDDERHLWPEMLRAIREIQPRWVVGENVLGLVNWNEGMVFEEVQADLESEGYEVQPFILPAAGVNAPHRRDRVWFVAYSQHNGHIAAKGGRSDGETGTRSEEGEDGSEQFEGICQPKELGGLRDATNSSIQRSSKREQITRRENTAEDKTRMDNRPKRFSNIGDATNANGNERSKGRMHKARSEKTERYVGTRNALGDERTTWENFPTQPPLRYRDDGVSSKLLRFVVNEFYGTDSYTSKKNRIKNVQEVRKRISQEAIWESIRRFYSLESKAVLLQVVQLYSESYKQQVELSPFGSKLCEPILRTLSKHGEFGRTPQGRRLQEQRENQFANTLSFLPHEVALAARRFEAAVAKFETWHRNESIKAAGNAIVPQVALQIFKAIEQYEELHLRQAQG